MIDIILDVLHFLSRIILFFSNKNKKYDNAVFNYQNTRIGKLNGSLHEDLALNLYVGFTDKSPWYKNFLSQNNFDVDDFKKFLLYLNKKDKKAKTYTKLILDRINKY